MDRAEFSGRRERLNADLAELGLDGFLVTALPNVAYLTGFTGSNGMLLVGGGPPVLLTDPRYTIQASEQTDCRVRIERGPLTTGAGRLVRKRGLRKFGFESSRTTHATHESLREQLALGVEAVPTNGTVERLRAVKSPAEIDLIRASVDLCSKAHSKAIRTLRGGMREFELAAELDHQMRLLGAEKAAFETIVASGERSALPHAEPSPKTINNNELLLIDMGAARRGYASDMTRMAHLGRPTRKVRKLYQAVLEAQLAALDRIRPGLTAGTVDRAARQVLKKHGLEREFVHSTGHGLGLEIHEQPRLGRGDRTRLEAGMVITVEPGAYLENFGGVRIEDTVVVTKNGCEVLTPTPKELLIV